MPCEGNWQLRKCTRSWAAAQRGCRCHGPPIICQNVHFLCIFIKKFDKNRSLAPQYCCGPLNKKSALRPTKMYPVTYLIRFRFRWMRMLPLPRRVCSNLFIDSFSPTQSVFIACGIVPTLRPVYFNPLVDIRATHFCLAAFWDPQNGIADKFILASLALTSEAHPSFPDYRGNITQWTIQPGFSGMFAP